MSNMHTYESAFRIHMYIAHAHTHTHTRARTNAQELGMVAHACNPDSKERYQESKVGWAT